MIYSKTNSENDSLQCIPGYSSCSPDFNSVSITRKQSVNSSFLLVWLWSAEASPMVPHIFPLTQCVFCEKRFCENYIFWL